MTSDAARRSQLLPACVLVDPPLRVCGRGRLLGGGPPAGCTCDASCGGAVEQAGREERV